MTQGLYQFGACTDWIGTGPGYFKSHVLLLQLKLSNNQLTVFGRFANLTLSAISQSCQEVYIERFGR
jgi:hypothetical protein